MWIKRAFQDRVIKSRPPLWLLHYHISIILNVDSKLPNIVALEQYQETKYDSNCKSASHTLQLLILLYTYQ